jgi:hypothetical protein
MKTASTVAVWHFVVLLLAITGNAFAQDDQKPKIFVPRIGASLYGAHQEIGQESAILPGISFYPGFRLYQQKNISLSLGVPLTVAASNKTTWIYGWNAGLSADVHVGYGANAQSTKGIGLLLGGGIGHTYVYNDDNFENTSEMAFAGPRLHGALVFRGSRTHESALMIWLQWQGNFNQSNTKDIYGIGICYQFRD